MSSIPRATERNAEIRRLHDLDGVAQRVLARRFGLSQGRVAEIIAAERRRGAAASAPTPEPAPAAREAPVISAPKPVGRPAPTRIVAMTHFGPDVEHADPATAAADAAPLWGGRYPKSPWREHSPMGSPAASCVEGGEA